MAIQYVSNGAVVEADNAPVSPGPGVTPVANDIMLAIGALQAGSGGRTLSCSGYTTIEERGVSGQQPISMFGKVCEAGEVNPTITPNGGTSGNVLQGVAILLRGADTNLATIKHNSSHDSTLNASNDNPIVTPALSITVPNCLVVLMVTLGINATSLGGFNPAGGGTWTQTIYDDTTTGNNQTFAVYTSLQTSPVSIVAHDVQMTGVIAPGSTARAVLVALNVGQTPTVFFPWLKA